MKTINLTKKILPVVALITGFCISQSHLLAQTQTPYLYNDCGKAKILNCDTNTVLFTNPVKNGDAIVWYYFNTTKIVESPIYFTCNTANIYSIGIYGPFATSNTITACNNSTMLMAQWPSNGIYHSFFPQVASYTTPIITFQPGFYVFHVRYINKIVEPVNSKSIFTVNMNCNIPKLDCINCIGSFAPRKGEYILSAWVKEDITAPNILTYTKPQIYIDFPTTNNPNGSTSSLSLGPFTAEGSIIDGWQRIEKEFSILSSATYINLRLQCASGSCFYDDIRIFPKDGSMKSYVYDPITLRLVAELDERNYATLYEYDEEGKLVRVKKETEKGIMTIKENKNSTKKKP